MFSLDVSVMATVAGLVAVLSPFVRVLAAVSWGIAMRCFGADSKEVRKFLLEAGGNAFKPRKPS